MLTQIVGNYDPANPKFNPDKLTFSIAPKKTKVLTGRISSEFSSSVNVTQQGLFTINSCANSCHVLRAISMPNSLVLAFNGWFNRDCPDGVEF